MPEKGYVNVGTTLRKEDSDKLKQIIKTYGYSSLHELFKSILMTSKNIPNSANTNVNETNVGSWPRQEQGIGLRSLVGEMRGASVLIHARPLAEDVRGRGDVLFTGHFWREFRAWSRERYSVKHSETVNCYAKRFYPLLDGEGIETVRGLSKNVRRHVMTSVSALALYLGKVDQWKQVRLNYGLRWEQDDGFKSFLSFLGENDDVKDVLDWIKSTKSILEPHKYHVLVYQAITGIRPNESVLSSNMIKDKIENYYDCELNMITHFKHKLFLRGTKNLYISFVTPKIVEVLKSEKKTSYYAIERSLEHSGLRCRMQDVRKWWATTMRAIVDREIVNLMQGRIERDVFTRYYYRPFLNSIKEKIYPKQEEIEKMLL